MFANPMPVSERTVGAQGDVMNGPKEHDECGCRGLRKCEREDGHRGLGMHGGLR